MHINTSEIQTSLKTKWSFFLQRALTYSSFLLIPIWIQKSLDVSVYVQIIMMILYILFMSGQWFMLGKEIDYRLNIYFRVNSSFDRIVYRLYFGMIVVILYFNLLSFLPGKWINNIFWTTWIILGLFYSWPTRGKIIRESVSSSFTEFKYLDRFEKTLLGLIIIIFIASIPQFPTITTFSSLKLFFDPLEKVNPQYWNFLVVNYYPFKKYPHLFKLALCSHFYFVGMGMFLISFYALQRYFMSRRASLLGVFALISSWSFSKILSNNFGSSLITTYSVIWVWSILWISRSASYRTGLFIGLIGYLGVLINPYFAFLMLVQIVLLYFFFLKDKTRWFRRQLLRYSLIGPILIFITFCVNTVGFGDLQNLDFHYFDLVISIIKRKAFFSLSIFGVLVILFKKFAPKMKIVKNIIFDMHKISQLTVSIFILFIFSLFFDAYLIKDFALMWIVALFSVLPLELLFQTISRLRLSRNRIYMIYILICLLDSHFEGRLKILFTLSKM